MAIFRNHRREEEVAIASPPLQLRITGPNAPVGPQPIDRLPLVLGRSSKCGIQLEDDQVSRRHAQITFDPSTGLQLTDLNSRNGVYHRGQRIREPLSLSPGTRLVLGPYRIEVVEANRDATGGYAGRSVIPTPDSVDSTLIELDQASASFDPEILTHLHQLDDELVRQPTALDRYQLICDFVIRQNAGTHFCAVLEYEPARTTDAVHIHRAASRTKPMPTPYLSQTLIGKVSQTRQAMMLSNTARPGSEDELMLSLAIDSGAVSAIACPLHAEAGPLLYATFDRRAADRRWLDLMVLIADQFRHAEAMVGLLEQTQQQAILERDLERARQIQFGLLPHAMEHPALDIAIGFEPCKTVGGDYADIITMPDGRLFVAIADVSGKGLPAALISSSIHTMVHAVIDTGGTPAQAMTQLNQYLIDFAPIGAFATMMMLAIDPTTGEAEVLNAGHLPIAHVASDGSGELLKQGIYLPLGIDPQTYEPQTMPLGPGDAWLLYSDGLSEMTTPGGAMLGNAGVLDLCRQMLKPTARETISHLLSWVEENAADREQADDQTLVLVRRNAM